MKFNKVLPLIAASIFVISSCGENSSSVTLSISNTSKTNTQLITPDKVEITETLGSIESKLITGQQFLPSTGDVNLLVIPVVIPGYETIDLNNDGNDDKEKVKNDIEISIKEVNGINVVLLDNGRFQFNERQYQELKKVQLLISRN